MGFVSYWLAKMINFDYPQKIHRMTYKSKHSLKK